MHTHMNIAHLWEQIPFCSSSPGYYISKASIKNQIPYTNGNANSDTIDIPLTDTTGTVVFRLDDFPALQCITQVDTLQIPYRLLGR
ncbi:MAG: hypothetical protein IPP71_23455 [Bacteroidetes bacterium]|nr:hypothetical protein [Bacteroidota bacterium]